MSVVCAACHTENRDHAMFCHGCAGKLPGFVATGPAALDIMRPLRLARMPATTDARVEQPPSPGLLQFESRAFWVRLGLVALAITVGFVGWYAYVTRRTALPVRPVVSAPAAPLVKPAGPEPGVAPAQAAPPAPSQVSAKEALSPGETLAPGRAVPQPPLPADVEPRNGTKQRESTPRRGDALTTPGGPTVRMRAADPRPGCAHLNFIAAARCEANQCLRAEFRVHPHCDAVREQTRRDEARRNLPN